MQKAENYLPCKGSWVPAAAMLLHTKSPFKWHASTPVSCIEVSICLQARSSKKAFWSFARVDYQTISDHIEVQLSIIFMSTKLQTMCKTHDWHAQNQHHKQLQQCSLPLNPSSTKAVPARMCWQLPSSIPLPCQLSPCRQSKHNMRKGLTCFTWNQRAKSCLQEQSCRKSDWISH